jgi:uncharacterized membrane protein YeaQ/YmgE (transglycosylase-associated protein family)
VESKFFLPLSTITWVLYIFVNMLAGRCPKLCCSKGNTGLLVLSLGGATAVAKVRTKWPNDDYVQTKVQRLANLIGTEINSWAVEKPRVNVKGITGLIMSLVGAIIVAKVRTKWLDNAYDQTTVQRPDKLIGTAMDNWNFKK